jgi:hypothetical protein
MTLACKNASRSTIGGIMSSAASFWTHGRAMLKI